MIDNGLQTRVDRAEQTCLLFIEITAGRACLAMGGQFAREHPTSGKRLQDLSLMLFALHRSFSANCFLARNNLDFTVPVGTPNIPATSSSVYP